MKRRRLKTKARVPFANWSTDTLQRLYVSVMRNALTYEAGHDRAYLAGYGPTIAKLRKQGERYAAALRARGARPLGIYSKRAIKLFTS